MSARSEREIKITGGKGEFRICSMSPETEGEGLFLVASGSSWPPKWFSPTWGSLGGFSSAENFFVGFSLLENLDGVDPIVVVLSCNFFCLVSGSYDYLQS